MAFCARCAAPNIDTAMVCAACGSPLAAGMPPGPGPGQMPQAAPPPPPAYYPYTPEQPKASGYAVGGFACALGSLACGLACIPGLILSLVALSDIKKSNGTVGGRGLAIAGVAISSVFVGIWVIVLVMLAIGAAVAPN